MARIKQLPNVPQENLVSSRRGDFLATALYWTYRDSVVVDLYVSGISQSGAVVLVNAVRTALGLQGSKPQSVVAQFVENVLELSEKAAPFASEGMTLDRVMGPEERAQILTAQLKGHDLAQRFPSTSEPVERSAALYNFSLNFLPSTINEFIAAYEGISVSAFKSRLNRARGAGLLSQREERIGGEAGDNAR